MFTFFFGGGGWGSGGLKSVLIEKLNYADLSVTLFLSLTTSLFYIEIEKFFTPVAAFTFIVMIKIFSFYSFI